MSTGLVHETLADGRRALRKAVDEALFHRDSWLELDAPLVVDATFDEFASRRVGLEKNVSRKGSTLGVRGWISPDGGIEFLWIEIVLTRISINTYMC